MNKVVNKVLISVVAMTTVTGCGIVNDRPYPNVFEDGQYGRLELKCDAAGCRELGTVVAGIIREGKAPDNAADTPYFKMRREQEKGFVVQKLNPNSKGYIERFKDWMAGVPDSNEVIGPNGKIVPQEQEIPSGS